MSDHFVIQSVVRWRNPYNGNTEDKITFLTIKGSVLENFKVFREQLGFVDSPHFTFQYIDEDDDLIPIASDNEFKEFTKVLRKRTFKGLMTRLVVDCNVPLEDEDEANKEKSVVTTTANKSDVGAKNHKVIAAVGLPEPKPKERKAQEGVFMSIRLPKSKPKDRKYPEGTFSKMMPQQQPQSYPDLDKLRAQIVQQVKSELLTDMRQLTPVFADVDTSASSAAGGLDKQSNVKNTRDELSKEEIISIGEKMRHTFNKIQKTGIKSVPNLPKLSAISSLAFVQSEKLPFIMSGEASKESLQLSRNVVFGKIFTHFWSITNDGTVPWTHVELRHVWSSTDLEPKTQNIKCPPLMPGQSCQLEVKFRAPKTLKQFISFWHFYYEVHSQWMQFGHYVSVSGLTKPQRLVAETPVATLSQDTPAENPEKENKLGEIPKAPGEPQNGLEMKLDGNLASAKIAAEMEMEAARIAKEIANNKKSSHVIKAHEKVVLGVPEPNSSDSDNGTDNEDNGPDGFEYVTVENCEGNNNNTMVSMPDNGERCEDIENNICELSVKENNNDTSVAIPLQQNTSVTVECEESTSSSSTKVSFLEHIHGEDQHHQDMNILRNQDHNKHSECSIYWPSYRVVNVPSVPNQQNNAYRVVNIPSVPQQENNAYRVVNVPSVPHQEDNAYRVVNVPSVPHQEDNAYRVVNVPSVPNQQNNAMKMAHNVPSSHHDGPIMSSTTPFKISFTPLITHSGPQKSQMPAIKETQTVGVVQPSLNHATTTSVVTDNELLDVPTNTVHILPQGLVEGAINVASSAYSTARKALNNLRGTEADSIKDFDPVFENNFALLVEMGFTNFERNARLLKRFNNDMDQVIAAICTSPHNLDID